MTAYERREQLISVGRSLFAQRDLSTLSVEEIAAAAKVTKPIIYEHFGGKEGLYAVVVDRELKTLSDSLNDFFDNVSENEHQTLEKGILVFLTYVEEHNEGFHVLLRDSPTTNPSGSFNTLLATVTVRTEKTLEHSLKRSKLPTKGAHYYATMIVGLTVFSAESWVEDPKISKEELAAYIVNMAWYGMRGITARPELHYEGKSGAEYQERKRREAEKERERERKRLEKEAKARGMSADEARAHAEAVLGGAAGEGGEADAHVGDEGSEYTAKDAAASADAADAADASGADEDADEGAAAGGGFPAVEASGRAADSTPIDPSVDQAFQDFG